MKIVIIEDERLTALDLSQKIQQVDSSVEIVAVLRSVKEGKEWFTLNRPPDLIFSDIQLGDGLSFEILEDQLIPVIFCTAYDEYALSAFHSNGIDYILKPFSSDSVAAGLRKYRNLSKSILGELGNQYDSIRKLLSNIPAPKPSSLLIYYQDTIRPIQFEDIALFELVKGSVSLITFDRMKYYPGKSLDELEGQMGADFFRVNRQFLISRKAIVNASSIFSRKLTVTLSVPVQDSITISKEKTPVFLKWLTGSIL